MVSSHWLQRKMMYVIFDSRRAGAPVTVETDGDYVPVKDFKWCAKCEEFHIVTGESDSGRH